MADDSVERVKGWVRDTGRNLQGAYTFKPQRESAGRAIEGAKKTVRETVKRYSDRAKKAMSGRKSSR